MTGGGNWQLFRQGEGEVGGLAATAVVEVAVESDIDGGGNFDMELEFIAGEGLRFARLNDIVEDGHGRLAVLEEENRNRAVVTGVEDKVIGHDGGHDGNGWRDGFGSGRGIGGGGGVGGGGGRGREWDRAAGGRP